jgi:hypothetical protein
VEANMPITLLLIMGRGKMLRNSISFRIKSNLTTANLK